VVLISSLRHLVYTSHTTSEPFQVYLAKAEESLLGAVSELDQGRYNNSVNRSYYACFHAAVAALQHAGLAL
jgi:uncharacterized protein (UPF0332 family)